MILVISNSDDVHAAGVLAALARVGAPAMLFDTGRFPTDLTLNLDYSGNGSFAAHVQAHGQGVELSTVRSVWWRRPQPYAISSEILSDEDRAFAYSECHAAISGLWSCLEARWMNAPAADEIAGRKAWQLKVAAGLKLRTPRTLISNDPEAVRRFVEREGERGTIYKAFSATERSWRETRLLKAEERERLDAVRFAPLLFQEYVRAVADIRITIVGDKVFPAEILSQATCYPVDFRIDIEAAEIRPHTLPEAVVHKLLRLMSRLGLAYGAIDMRLTPEGEYVFLEINPAGQFLFIEQHTDQPITAAVAEHLATAELVESREPDPS